MDGEPDFADRAHRPRGRAVVVCRVQLSLRRSAGGTRIRPRGISAAIARNFRHRQVARRDHASDTWLAEAEGVGLCRIHLRLDFSARGASPGGRSCLRTVHADRAADIAGRFVRDQAGEPAMAGGGKCDAVAFRHRDAGNLRVRAPSPAAAGSVARNSYLTIFGTAKAVP